MSLFLNELSLEGQFSTSQAFLVALDVIMQAREEAEKHQCKVYCCDALRSARVTQTSSFSEEVKHLGNKTQKTDIIRWFERTNWTMEPQHTPNHYFAYNDNLVTDTSIAEAAFRFERGENSSLLSFAPSPFHQASVEVIWHRDSENQKPISLPNVFYMEGVTALLHQWSEAKRNHPLTTWGQLIEWGRQYCPHLMFAEYILEPLRGIPFYPSVAQQAQKRFEVLESLVSAVDSSGRRTAQGHALYQEYFTGDRAWFTPESNSNKQKFAKELTFPHPAKLGETLFCSWHGKISQETFRIHFHWPLSSPTELLYIVYIGPKITKK